MSSVAAPRSPAVERLQHAAERVSGPQQGRLLLGFGEKRLKKDMQELLDLMFEFDPEKEKVSEEDFELLDAALSSVISRLQAKKAGEPFWDEAIGKLTAGRHWIIRGYCPGSPPSEDELLKVKDAQASRILEALSKSPS